MNVKTRCTLAVLAAAGLFWANAALGGISDLLGAKSPFDAYVGTWTNPEGGPSEIDHIVISTTGSEQVRIQTFGRCGSQICSWGVLPGRARSDSPQSAEVRSISVDYNLGFALRHITLRPVEGNALRFEVVTEFTDGSARHDFETSGRLLPLGAKPAASTPAATAAPAGALAADVKPVAAGANAAPPAQSKSWWNVFGDEGNSAASRSMGPGDCITFDTEHSYVAPDKGNWKVRDFLHTVQKFGPYRNAANRALTVISYYHFDEVCRIGNGVSDFVYYRALGEVPHTKMPQENCVETHPDKVEAVLRDGDWKVVDGGREIYDYGSDQQAAQQAASAIKVLRLGRQCYFDRDNTSLSYWQSH